MNYEKNENENKFQGLPGTVYVLRLTKPVEKIEDILKMLTFLLLDLTLWCIYYHTIVFGKEIIKL